MNLANTIALSAAVVCVGTLVKRQINTQDHKRWPETVVHEREPQSQMERIENLTKENMR